MKYSIQKRIIYGFLIVHLCTLMILICANIFLMDRIFIRQKKSDMVTYATEVVKETFLVTADSPYQALQQILLVSSSPYDVRLYGVEQIEEEYLSTKRMHSWINENELFLIHQQGGRRTLYFQQVIDLGEEGVNRLIFKEEIPLMSNNNMQLSLIMTIIIALLVTLPSIILLSYLLKRISKPLTQLVYFANDIAEENFGTVFCYDIPDEIGKLVIALNQMSEKLLEHHENKKIFIASISHELRTPLSTLKLTLKAMLDHVVPETKQDKYYISSLEEVERLTLMVNDLITLSSFEQSRLQFHRVPIELNQLLVEVQIQLQMLLEKKQLKSKIICNPSFEIMADRYKIKQVFLNILDNAIKFSPISTMIQIIVREKDNMYCVQIIDEGCGVSEELLPHLFDSFSKKKESSGLGLGLYISKKIITEHQGTITAYANPHMTGLVIEINLPKRGEE